MCGTFPRKRLVKRRTRSPRKRRRLTTSVSDGTTHKIGRCLRPLDAGLGKVMKLGRDLRCHNRGRSSCFKLHERLCRVPGGWPAAVRSPLRGPAAPKTGTPGSAAVVEGHLIAVGVGERESAAERPVGGR